MVMDDAYYNADQLPNMAVLDGGATSFLVGRNTLKNYVNKLQDNGYDVQKIKFHSCEKVFRFGNDKTELSELCAILPVSFGRRVGEILVYVVDGSTPFLFARPVMEQMELTVDFGEKRLRWKGGPWFPVVSSPIGHYLLDMLEDIDLLVNGTKPQYTLLPVDLETHVRRDRHCPS